MPFLAESQSTILTKLAGSANGGLSLLQGPSELNTAIKFAVKDAAGNAKSVISAKGYVGIGTQTLANALTIDTSILAGEAQYAPAILIQGTSSNERLELRSSSAPIFQGRHFSGTVAAPGATTNNAQLFTLGGGGHTGSVFSNNIAMRAGEAWSPSANGSYIQFATSPNGIYSDWATERMRLTGDEKLGIGVTAPTQKLEVKEGGIRINAIAQGSIPAPAARPTCDDASRGTFWFINGGAADDSMSVCAKVGGSFTWKALWQ